MNKKMWQTLNEQVNHELYAAYLYLAMAAYFEDKNFQGFAYWMHKQSKEEIGHAMKIYNYLYERGSKVELLPIAQPKTVWKSPLDAFKDALKHEQKVTGLINNLVTIAEKEKDRAAFSFLQWYVDEQVEEENQVNEIIAKLEMIKDCSGCLLMLNHELGKRE